jgi:hypothetical protein
MVKLSFDLTSVNEVRFISCAFESYMEATGLEGPNLTLLRNMSEITSTQIADLRARLAELGDSL